MRLIANRQLTGDYGTVPPGAYFDADEDTALSLIKRGLATQTDFTYETKVITPEAPVVTATPFRHLPDPDPEPAALAAVRASVRAVSDVLAQGTPGSVERPRRGRPRKP